jgi:pheganomycin biosynthesis PGM1-like protein/ATP-grasp domain-containing protein
VSWDDRQRALAARLSGRPLTALEEGTLVVVPSTTFPSVELRKITGIEHYEERMLFTLLLLRRPELRLVFVTGVPVDGAVVDYFLRHLPDPDDARRRLQLVSVDDPEPRALSAKLLARPDVLEQIRVGAGDASTACVLPFNVTQLERRVSDALNLPVFGASPEHFALGSKTGSRRVARRAGVAVVAGAEGLDSIAAIDRAITEVLALRPDAGAVVVKLNNGFSGQGNAIIDVADLKSPLDASLTTFCATDESWPSFVAKIEAEGAIVEELLRHPDAASPSVQLRIAPDRTVEVLSTHDQVLGGPDRQIYLGCRFPAQVEYRAAITDAARRVAEVLAVEGVIGSFGIDFVVVPAAGGHDVYLSEINLRLGGTTHPFWMARLVTGGMYDEDRGELVARGTPLAYVATDNLKTPRLVGRQPSEVIDTVDKLGLAFDAATGTGVTLHLLGAIPRYGKMGAVCIGHSPEEADELNHRLATAVAT